MSRLLPPPSRFKRHCLTATLLTIAFAGAPMISGIGLSAAHADEVVSAPIVQFPKPAPPDVDEIFGKHATPDIVVEESEDTTLVSVVGTGGFLGARFDNNGSGFGFSGGATHGDSGVGAYVPLDDPKKTKLTGVVSGRDGTVTFDITPATGDWKLGGDVPIGHTGDDRFHLGGSVDNDGTLTGVLTIPLK